MGALARLEDLDVHEVHDPDHRSHDAHDDALGALHGTLLPKHIQAYKSKFVKVSLS